MIATCAQSTVLEGLKIQPPNTHTHPFNGPLSGTTQVSRYQKRKTNLDFTEAKDSEWQWHQLGRMQVCTSLQRDNHTSTPPLSFFTGRMPFLPPYQQRQSTEGKIQPPNSSEIAKVAENCSLQRNASAAENLPSLHVRKLLNWLKSY